MSAGGSYHFGPKGRVRNVHVNIDGTLDITFVLKVPGGRRSSRITLEDLRIEKVEIARLGDGGTVEHIVTFRAIHGPEALPIKPKRKGRR